ncbi:MAG TPA: 6-bladed beta-propeller [Nitrosopumilaceae archaeon]|nr:6-bladed beta-propeller [Nitrosopumilaceae archaeon]
MKITLYTGLLFLTLIFLLPQDAHAITIDAVPEYTNFGPNDNISVDLNIHGYDIGSVLWVAHRPDGSTISGSLDQLKGGMVTHQIFRNAFDNYFGNWSIDYTYHGIKQTVSFNVEPIKLVAIPDKELYYEPDIMKINITTSYYIPVAAKAQVFHLNFYDNDGNFVKSLKQIDIMPFQYSTIYNFPIADIIDNDNPPGEYKFKIQYYNLSIEVPFLIDDVRNLMTIFLQTDKQTYHIGDGVNLHLLFTRVKESSGIMKITNPLSNTTTSTFPVTSVNTNLYLENITSKPGTYNLEIQYAGITQKGSFQVIAKPTLKPNIDLEIFLDKLKYKPGEIISAKIHTTNLITDSLSFWFGDPSGKQNLNVTVPMKSGDMIIPHKIDRNDLQGMWNMYIDYGGATRTATFFVQGLPIENIDAVSSIKFSKPKLLTILGSDDNVNFKNPRAIAIDSSDNIYVVDSGNSQIKKFDSTGKLLLSWGSFGSGNGQFRNPSGILVDQKYVYITDTGHAQIQKFDKNGNFVLAWGTYGEIPGMFHTPIALAEDRNGDIFVLDSGTNKIQIFDINGKYKGELHPVLTNGGNFTATNSIVFDSQNNFYVVTSDTNRILKYNNNKDFINYFGSTGTEEGRFNNPNSIAVDSNGYIYVADTNNYRIQKFDSDGTFLVSWGSFGTGPRQFANPVGLAIDSKNNVYVIDKTNNNIQKFSSFGNAGEITIPTWVKNNAKWWSEDLFSNTDFATGINYLIRQGVIQGSITSNESNSDVKIPRWVKTNADWWTNGLISDKEFTSEIQYLVSVGIIKT